MSLHPENCVCKACHLPRVEQRLAAALAELTALREQLAYYQKEEQLLIDLWRSDAFAAEGRDGDACNLSPSGNAVDVLHRQRTRLSELREQLATVTRERDSATERAETACDNEIIQRERAEKAEARVKALVKAMDKIMDAHNTEARAMLDDRNAVEHAAAESAKRLTEAEGFLGRLSRWHKQEPGAGPLALLVLDIDAFLAACLQSHSAESDTPGPELTPSKASEAKALELMPYGGARQPGDGYRIDAQRRAIAAALDAFREEGVREEREWCATPSASDTVYEHDPNRGKTVQHLTESLIGAVRREALEEAAKIAESKASIEKPGTFIGEGYNMACDQVAKAIRAAKDV